MFSFGKIKFDNLIIFRLFFLCPILFEWQKIHFLIEPVFTNKNKSNCIGFFFVLFPKKRLLERPLLCVFLKSFLKRVLGYNLAIKILNFLYCLFALEYIFNKAVKNPICLKIYNRRANWQIGQLFSKSSVFYFYSTIY